MDENSGGERSSRSLSPSCPAVALQADESSPSHGAQCVNKRASQYGFNTLQLNKNTSRAATLLESTVSSATDLSKATDNLKKILGLQKILLHAPSTDARLLERRGQMHEVDQALLMQQKYYAKEEEQFRLKESQLREKEAQLHVQLERFNKFIDTNAEKKHRAQERAAADRVTIQEEEKKIAVLKVELEQKEADCNKLEACARKYKIFEEFLAAAVRQGEDFQEISDLMTRYELLRSIHTNLVKKEGELNEKSDRVRNALSAYKKHAANEILEKNNTIAALQRELEVCEKEKVSKQGQADEFLSHTTDEALYIGQLLLSIQNLFQRCSEKRPNLQHGICLARLLTPQQPATPAEQLPGGTTGNCVQNESPPRDEGSKGATAASNVQPDAEEGNKTSACGSAGAIAQDSPSSSTRKVEGLQTEESTSGRAQCVAAAGAAARGTVYSGNAGPLKGVGRDRGRPAPPYTSAAAAAGANSTPAETVVSSGHCNSTPAPKGGSDTAGKRGNAANAAEKRPESPADQRKACDDAIKMLEVVERYLKDFKDICETLTKNRRQQLKGCRVVNLNVNYAQEDDVIEFVKVYDSRGQRNVLLNSGDSTKDALSSVSSKKFLPRTRMQGLRQMTAQTLPLSFNGSSLKSISQNKLGGRV